MLLYSGGGKQTNLFSPDVARMLTLQLKHFADPQQVLANYRVNEYHLFIEEIKLILMKGE